MRKSLSWWTLLAWMVTWVCGATGQQLPEELAATVVPDEAWATRFEVPMGSASGDRVKAFVGLQNVGQNALHFSWQFKTGGAAPGSLKQTETVAYQPTAVCARSPLSDTLYVAGWNASLDAVVVEEWTCDRPFALSQVALPDGGTMSTVSFTKRAFFMARKENAFPIRAMVCNPYTNELLLLPFVAGPSLMTLDVADGVLGVTPITSVSYPYLATARTLDGGVQISPPAFVVVARDLGHYDGSGTGEAVTSGEVLALVDLGMDGSFESVSKLTWTQFHTTYPHASWDHAYTDPPP